jgi:hypothetical protein
MLDIYELPKIHELQSNLPPKPKWKNLVNSTVPVMILDLTIPFLTSGLDLRGSFQTGWLSPVAR